MLQAIDRSDGTRKFFDGGLIVEVSFLRNLRHSEMIAHQENDEVDFFAVKAEACGDFGGEARAGGRRAA